MSTARLAFTVVFVLALLAPGASQSLAQPAASPAAPASLAASGSMLIVENAGQWPAAARFQVWNSPLGPGVTWLAEDAIWLVVASGKLRVAGSKGSAGPRADLPPANLPPATLHALKLTFPGSNPDVRIEPFGALDTVVSYFLGNDPAQWRPDVPVWGGVRYVDLYPGVDLVMGGRDAGWRLEAAPGAAIEQVRVQFAGAEIVDLNGAALQLQVGGQVISIELPSSAFDYQAIGSFRQGKPFSTEVREASFEAGQRVSKDDPGNQPYRTYLGGSGEDRGYDIAIDGTGSIFVTGYTRSSNFPTTPGALDPSFDGETDVFVARLSPSGGALEYSTFLGGGAEDWANVIELDDAGQATVAGSTHSNDFPTTPGAFDPVKTDWSFDAFVTRLSPDGASLVHSTFLGGSDTDEAIALVVDGMGSTYVSGKTSSRDFPATAGAYANYFSGGFYDAFIVRLDTNGSAMIFGTYLGGRDWDQAHGLAVDNDGRIAVAGFTRSSDFPTTPGAFDTSFNGNLGDAFVTCLLADGSGLAYSTFLGGSNWDQANDVALDSLGRAIVTGGTVNDDFPVTSQAFDPSYNGGSDGFITRLAVDGRALVDSTYVGGSGLDRPYAITVTSAGKTFVVGYTTSRDFPVMFGAFDPVYNGDDDAFMVSFAIDSQALIYSTFLGGSGTDQAYGVAVDVAEDVAVAGLTNSSDFPASANTFDPSHNGNEDAFVARLSLTTTPFWLPLILKN
jgi:hypothetical protein